ncbi:MAG: 3-deoxy-manno-octulosonate cytidylyltransferase, partial [Gemmatimonadetes bacterium]|nr:3-deoxy-manno-octulosonate cytidylyltransferase [Gemmatimonadota bacterium]
MGVICVLPARLSSTRIPRKPLQMIAGRTLLEWCGRAASEGAGL